MDTQWYLETHGDPLGKVRDFISSIWLETGMQGLLVTMNGGSDGRETPRFVTDFASLSEINPFKPLMEVNAARLIPGLLAEHPDAPLGALLRPCEIRALIEMTRHIPINLDHLITISVDCLGTLPADEYQWRLERIQRTSLSEEKGSTDTSDELASEASIRTPGGIVPYRYRSACQVCTSSRQPGYDKFAHSGAASSAIHAG
jgi:formate dehydrogenase subunit beta